jgi:hypothetical protein
MTQASAGRIAQRELISAAQAGGITLVIGAGVSMPRGIPDWNTLAQAVWWQAFPDQPDPWSRNSESSPNDIPQFLPIAFELAYQHLGEPAFLELLKHELYKNAKFPITEPRFGRSNESLAVIGRLLVAEQKREGGRRIAAVITLNADDLIEQSVSRAAGYRDDVITAEIAATITRSTHRIISPSSIPIYHVHGFLPSDQWKTDSGPRRMLVFTDLQYWTTSAAASSFANRIVSAALSESRCIFIGVSMKDINLLRWLALRSLDRDRDQLDFGQERLLRWISDNNPDDPRDDASLLKTVQSFLKDPATNKSRSLERSFRRHFWIRTPAADPSGFLSRFLDECRGVRPVEIDDWRGTSFRSLLRKCFPSAGRQR